MKVMAASENPNPMPVAESPEPARRDFRREVTDRIINMLETGVAPWQKPWNPADASPDMPMNPTTGKSYRGATRFTSWRPSSAAVMRIPAG